MILRAKITPLMTINNMDHLIIICLLTSPQAVKHTAIQRPDLIMIQSKATNQMALGKYAY